MAFWELSLISSRFDARRKSIYLENDRTGGSTWSQILALCVAELSAIDNRIKAYHTETSPPPPPAAAPTLPSHSDAIDKKVQVGAEIYTKDAITGYKTLTAHKIDSFVRSHGQAPGATSPPAKLLELGAQTFLSSSQRAALEPRAVYSKAGGLIGQLLSTQPGALFRHTFDRRVTGVVCGAPSSRSSIIIDAVDSIAALAVHSIREDKLGCVQSDLPGLLRTIAATMRNVWGFVATASPHWTDVKFQPEHRDSLPEVDAVLAALVKALESIVREFGEFFNALGISKAEEKEWMALLAKAKELEEVKERRKGRREQAKAAKPVRKEATRRPPVDPAPARERAAARPRVQGGRPAGRTPQDGIARPRTPEMQQVGAP
jgi:nucleoporin NDC1